MFTNMREVEATYHHRTKGDIVVYSDYPPAPPAPKMTTEEILARAEYDLHNRLGDRSVLAMYTQDEYDQRKVLPKFYVAIWNRQQVLKTNHMPSKEEAIRAVENF